MANEPHNHPDNRVDYRPDWWPASLAILRQLGTVPGRFDRRRLAGAAYSGIDRQVIVMPFKKTDKGDYVSPSGRHFTEAQVRLYYAHGGHFPGEHKRARRKLSAPISRHRARKRREPD